MTKERHGSQKIGHGGTIAPESHVPVDVAYAFGKNRQADLGHDVPRVLVTVEHGAGVGTVAKSQAPGKLIGRQRKKSPFPSQLQHVTRCNDNADLLSRSGGLILG